ncbi:MAG: GTPase HflX [Terriglobales bacterium]
METALLVGVEFTDPRARRGSAPGGREPEASLAELRELAQSAGARVAGSLIQRRPRPESATLLGAGKVEELAALARGLDLVIFDCELTPTQQRNLERAVGARVLARTQLILDIFAGHARTREGQLQVELAQLEYLLPRLAGRGVAMSRLGGGIGTRGPGETQLETDRRRIHHRIRGVRQALEQVRRQRGEQRRQRESVPLTTVALVGYTNAGKSTLFNRLTGAGVLTSQRMFATLDPTIRALRLPSKRTVLLSDTVGFVHDLPHGLISAFRATLEEVTRASLLLVVADAQAPDREEHERQVQRVLLELGVEGTPRVRVWNKSDLLGPGSAASQPGASEGDGAPLLVSARTGEGLEALIARLERELPLEAMEEVRLRLPHTAGRTLHLLHERGEVLAERHRARWVELSARVPESLLREVEPYRKDRNPANAIRRPTARGRSKRVEKG